MFTRATNIFKTRNIYTIAKRFSSNHKDKSYKFDFSYDRKYGYAALFDDRMLRAFGGLVGALNLNSKLDGKTVDINTVIGGLIGYICPSATIILCGTPMITPYLFGPKSN
jgi:hypothetical protein